MNIDYGINLMLSVVSMLYSVINIQMSVVRVEIFAYHQVITLYRTAL